METALLTEGKSAELILEAIKKVVNPRGYKGIKANVDEFETPSRLQRSEDEVFIPDITGIKAGKQSYFEIVIKSDSVREMVTKWKLLSSLARMRNGDLYLISPKGNYTFAQKLIRENDIPATIVRL